MNVFIADDEEIVLEGLKYIIDWNSLGFSICGTATNGMDALNQILALQPDLVLLDIRMPKLNGIDVVEQAVSKGYNGKFIILSGVANFKMAQTAMRNGVDFYLTKPIDEDELSKAVISVRDEINDKSNQEKIYKQYKSKAINSILLDILHGTADIDRLDIKGLNLDSNLYQVIAYENYNQNYIYQTWDFEKMFRIANEDQNSFFVLKSDMQNILLLMGNSSLSKFQRLLKRYQETPMKGSPLDSIFLAYGRVVSRLSDIPLSFHDVQSLGSRRFFCKNNQHILGYQELKEEMGKPTLIKKNTSFEYARRFVKYIESNNTMQLRDTLNELSDFMYHTQSTIPEIRHTLIDIYISVKQQIMQQFPNTEIPFPPNATVIGMLEKKYYLYEIIDFMQEQFKLMMKSVGVSNGANTLADIQYYIKHNYMYDLKLESIAPLFGYSSSYLGKLFSQKGGINFNAYLDKVRIHEAKKLLKNPNLKVYEIAAKVGYKDVNYFYIKFRKNTGTSPAEYRQNNLSKELSLL
ncbi:MAG: response regulator [Lachnospiraceae bacterium]|nr:response regulator [Lachnospiraceae bacterium]